MDKVRVDRWLWSVRIFKSRTIAAEACKKGKVKIGEDRLKPASFVREGDLIHVHKNGYDLQFEVVQLLQKRVSAPLAQAAYINHTPEEEMRKFEDWFIGKAKPEMRERGSGRPTKKERRELDEYKGWTFEDD